MQGEVQIPIIILANDKVLENCLSLLESIKNFGFSGEVYFVPYDNNTEKCEEIFGIYGVKKLEFDFSCIDSLSEALFPDKPSMRNRLRKLSCFMTEWSNFIYLDTDIIVTSDIIQRFGSSIPEYDLVYATASKGWVYDEGADEKYTFVKNSKRFSTGFFYCSRSNFDWKNIGVFIEKNSEEFLKVRRHGVIDQPIINYFADKNNAKISSVSEIYSEFHRDTYIDVLERERAMLKDSSGLYLEEKKVPFVHWAGPEKDLAKRSVVVDNLRKSYIRRAYNFLLERGCSEKLLSLAL